MGTDHTESLDLSTVAAEMAEQVKASSVGTLMERMEIELVEVSPSRLVATMPVAGNTQPYGLLHGGANAVLAETLGSMGAGIHATRYERLPVGIEISCTHHRAARKGVVTGVATPLSSGRSLSTWHIEIRDEDDQLICTSRLTCMLREAPPGS